MNTVLKFEELQGITGYERAGDVVRNLRAQGIAVFIGKGGAPWTTTELILAAGNRTVEEGSPVKIEPYNPDVCR